MEKQEINNEMLEQMELQIQEYKLLVSAFESNANLTNFRLQELSKLVRKLTEENANLKNENAKLLEKETTKKAVENK